MIETRLAEIEEFVAKYMEGKPNSTAILGLAARTEIPKLIKALRKCMEQRDTETAASRYEFKHAINKYNKEIEECLK